MRNVTWKYSSPVHAGLMLGLCLLMPIAASARDFVVTRTDDPAIVGDRYCPPSLLGCSLRGAVLAANENPGLDRILLGPGTFTLTLSNPGHNGHTGPLLVTDRLDFIGQGSSSTRIRWAHGLQHTNSIARFVPIVASSGDTRMGTLTGLSVSHGRGADGGCLYSNLPLQLTDTVVEQCQGISGGGLKIIGKLLLKNTLFRGNRADTGGAIYARPWFYVLPGGIPDLPPTIRADGAEFVDNEATSGGGALSIEGLVIDGYESSLSWRNEGEGSRFIGNSAPRGGALWVYGQTDVKFASYPANGPRTLFEDNVAADLGGAVHQQRVSLTLEDALFRQNAAASGGAIHANGALVLRDVEFDGNSAQDSVGGALAVARDPDLPLASIDIDRAAFNGNSAALAGGAIANECNGLALRNVSFHANRLGSANGLGTAVASSGNTSLVHSTSALHASTKPTFARTFHTACGSQPFRFANSVIGGNDSCHSVFGGPIASNGGNQFGPGAGQCQPLSLEVDQRQSNAGVFGLSLGTFGGVMPVLGWNADGLTRPQVGFGVSAYCSPYDIRNLPRPAARCDSGAFEQQ